jgi:hypothetical protein
MNADKLPVWQMSVDEVKALIETNRQQADRIAELEKGINKILEGCRNVKKDNPNDKNLKDLATLVISDCNLLLREEK